MKRSFKIVIPARYGSERLPGKPLLEIAGKPMIAHVCARAVESGAEQVVVATDDERIAAATKPLGIQSVMTDAGHTSGTERIEEVARTLNWSADDIVVNLQGDEPMMPAGYINKVAEALLGQERFAMSTLASVIHLQDDIFNPHAVKVVVDSGGRALYFSRAPIPWHRDHFPTQVPEEKPVPYLRHIGIYAYSVDFLRRYCAWEPSPLEAVERLEQLRVLWYGESIRVDVVETAPEAGIDTEADFIRVTRALSAAV